ncbi:MAG: SOS response-associated peptidase [Deltaproteobacteria bacterium]|nr:SOS response-associated peptidase [Nannocystaceae bacterium]
MCGRFTLTTNDYESVAAALDADWDPQDAALYRPRFNVAPTDRCPIVVAGAGGRRKLGWATWGLVMPRDRDKPKPPVQINARAETVATRGFFRNALLRIRCAVVADGFYEWVGPKQARKPIRFHREDGALIGLAGIALPWRHPESGEQITRFAIVTTTPNRLIAGAHDRMPAMLEGAELDAWLDAPPPDLDQQRWLDRLVGYLHPASDDALVATAASPRANDVRNDDPGVLFDEQPSLL